VVIKTLWIEATISRVWFAGLQVEQILYWYSLIPIR
jgi:hypothetical protein